MAHIDASTQVHTCVTMLTVSPETATGLAPILPRSTAERAGTVEGLISSTGMVSLVLAGAPATFLIMIDARGGRQEELVRLDIEDTDAVFATLDGFVATGVFAGHLSALSEMHHGWTLRRHRQHRRDDLDATAHTRERGDVMSTITAHADLYTMMVIFQTTPDAQERLAEDLRGVAEIHSRHDGFISCSIHASNDGQRVVEYIQWRSKADVDAMLATPDGRAHLARAARDAEMRVYRVASVTEL